MSDVTGGAATAVAAGIGAAFVAAVGVEPQALVWGFVGAVFGAPLAPSAGRIRTAFVFLAVVLAAALIGTVAADAWHTGARGWRNFYAVLVGLAFHPLAARFVAKAPALVDKFMPGGAQPPNGGQ